MSRRSRSRSRGADDDLSESQARERVDGTTARLSVEFHIRRQEYEDEIKMRKSLAEAPVAPAPPVKEEKDKKDKKDKKPKFDAPNWHQNQIQDIMTTFELSSMDLGLSSEFAAQRLIEKGPNIIRPPQPSVLWKILGYIFGGFNILLLGSAVLSIIAWRIGTPPDPNNLGLAIILVLVAAISAGFNWYQEHKSSKVMDTIKKLLPTEVQVVRDGAEKLIAAADLVVGDVVVLRNGDRVPADLRLVDVRGLRIDSAALTGESEPVSSSATCTDSNYLQTRNIAFCGTNIVEGTARGIVVSTGNSTVMGSIASAASSSSERSSGLQLEIRRVVIVIAILAAITATAVILTWVFWLNPTKPSFMNLPSMLATVIGIMVAFLPDGLPFCIVLALTLVAKQMSLNSVVVKHLPTVETLGTVDVLASDKTGTLTQNKMSVVHLFTLPNNLVDVPENKKVLVGKPSTADPQARKLVLLSALCSGAKFEAHEVGGDSFVNVGDVDDDFADTAKILGDASDTAIMRFAAHNTSIEVTRKQWPKLFDIPFNSKNKWMLTIHAIPVSSASLEASEESTKVKNSKKELYDGENAELASAHLKHKALLIMKGAGEIILSRCSRYMDEDGSLKPLTDTQRKKLARQQEKLGSHGERVLGFGYSEFSVDKRFPIFSKAFDEDRERFEIPSASQTLIFVGFVALMDPPRPEVPPAVQKLRRAGVRVMMVTGDHSTTALAIARKVGIVTTEDVDLVTKDTVWDLINDQSARGLITSSVYHHDKKKSLRSETPEQLSVAIDESNPVPQRAIAITGADMGVFDDKVWDWVIAHDEIVFARTTPEDKLKIVTELQRRKHVVSMTGDGVNDAPALRQAEAGVAMGAGSDVAKEAADVILTDNNFSSILVAIEYGRLVFDNLTKVLLYLFPSGSFCEIVPVILNVWLGVPLPLSAFLMIYLACFTDVGPALALIKERSEGNLMLRAPRRKDQHLVGVKTFAHAYGYLGIIEAMGAHIMYFWYMHEYARLSPSQLFLAFDAFNQDNFGGSGLTAAQLQLHLRAAQSVYFVAVVVMQFGNMLATRTQFLSFFSFNPFKGVGRNVSMFIAMGVSIVLAVLIIYVPPFNDIFGTRPIPFQFWFLPVIFSVTVFVADEIRKLFLRRYFSSDISKELEM